MTSIAVSMKEKDIGNEQLKLTTLTSMLRQHRAGFRTYSVWLAEIVDLIFFNYFLFLSNASRGVPAENSAEIISCVFNGQPPSLNGARAARTRGGGKKGP